MRSVTSNELEIVTQRRPWLVENGTGAVICLACPYKDREGRYHGADYVGKPRNQVARFLRRHRSCGFSQ